MQLHSPDNNGVCWCISNYLAFQLPDRAPALPDVEPSSSAGSAAQPAGSPDTSPQYMCSFVSSSWERSELRWQKVPRRTQGLLRSAVLGPSSAASPHRTPDARAKSLFESKDVERDGRELQRPEQVPCPCRGCSAWPRHGSLHSRGAPAPPLRCISAEPSGRCQRPRRVPTVGAFCGELPRPGPRCCRRRLRSRQECKCRSSAPRRNSSGGGSGGGGGIAAPSLRSRRGNDHLCPSLAPAASSEPITARCVLPPRSPPGEGAHL